MGLIRVELFAAQLINGLTLGSTYALVALGVVLIFSVLDVMSVTQGELFIASGYVGFVFVLGATHNLALAAIAVVVASLVLGAIVERVAVRPALSGGHLATLITTVGVALVLTNLVIIVFGPYSQVIPNDAMIRPLLTAGRVAVRPIDVLAVSVLLFGFVALKSLIGGTRLGAAIRAVAENSDVAAMFGTPVTTLRALTFIVGSGLAGLAAVILGFKYGNLTPDLGIEFTLKALTVAIVGGGGRIEGAVIAAFGLAIVESMTTGYLGADLTDLVGFSLLFVFIIAFPEGLFRRQLRRAG